MSHEHTKQPQDWDNLYRQLDGLKGSLDALHQESHLELQQLREAYKRVKAENLILATRLSQAELKLEKFRQLLVEEPDESPPDPLEPTKQAEQPSIQLQRQEAGKPDISSPQHQSVKKKPVGRKPGKAFERAQFIFDCIQAWNHQNPDDTFVVNPGFLESVFHINRKAAKQFCSALSTAITQHHQDIGVKNPISHNRRKETTALQKFVREQAQTPTTS